MAPMFEFRCEHDHLFEELCSEGDRPPCPHCNSIETYRIISPSSFRLKGAGFHATDYSRFGRKKANKLP